MTVPTEYLSNFGFLGFGKETTFGTGVAATDYAPIESEGFETDPGFLPIPTIRGVRAENNVSYGGELKSIGKLDLPLYPTSGILLLALALGHDVVTGSSAPYTHTMTPLESGLPSFTVEKNLGGLTSLQYAGCIVNKASFTLATNAPVKASYDILAQVDSQISASTPTFGADTPYALANIAVSKFAAADTNVDMVSFDIDNKAKAKYTFTGNRYSTLNYSGARVITGKLSTILQTMTDYNNAMAGTYGALVLTLTIDSGHQITITMPKILWGKPTQPLKLGEIITQELPFTAYFLPGQSYDIQVAVKNSVSSAYV